MTLQEDQCRMESAMGTTEDRLEKLRNCEKVQGSKGNFDQGEYMRGYYNGIELALSIMEGREPNFKEATGASSTKDPS